jgi:hypothetical protein
LSAQAKHAREKETREKNQIFSIKSPSLWVWNDVADFACSGSTPHISASLKFDTIRTLIRQFWQHRLQEKVE